MKDQKPLRDLQRTIATKLLEEGGFVALHFDGDSRWSERGKLGSDNEQKFHDVLCVRVEQAAVGRQPLPGASAVAASVDEAARLTAMTKLLALVPFYSVESWLYQDTEEVVALCFRRHRGAHNDSEGWREYRFAPDEFRKPKDLLCLGDGDNLLLARALSAELLYERSPSFRETTDRVSGCEPLRSAFQGLVSSWSKPPGGGSPAG